MAKRWRDEVAPGRRRLAGRGRRGGGDGTDDSMSLPASALDETVVDAVAVPTTSAAAPDATDEVHESEHGSASVPMVETVQPADTDGGATTERGDAVGADREPRTSTMLADEPVASDSDSDSDSEPGTPAGSGSRGHRRTPTAGSGATVGSTLSALVIGAVVGLAVVGLVFVGMRAFEAVLGTPAGGNWGAAALLGVVVVAIVLGRVLLGLRRLPDPSSTSMLGVLFALIVVAIGFVGIVFDTVMIGVLPATCAVTYALGHLLAASFGPGAGRD